MMKYIPDVKAGDKFGRLTYVDLAHRNPKSRQWYWKCVCDCGKEVVVMGSNVKHGKTNSCGCYQKDRVSQTMGTHRKSGTKVHKAWKAMRQRCFNKNTPAFENYGGRGIDMSPEWAASFELFYRDMGEPPTSKHSLERIDNERGYHPDNVRWATSSEQIRNRRISVWVTYQNTQRFLKELCDSEGLNYFRAYDMIVRRNIKVETAVELLRSSKEFPISQELEEPPKG